MKFIGDVHGKFGAYKTLIKANPSTIQVGDLGIGFRQWPHGEWKTNPPYDEMVEANARFIRGNHDNPCVCLNNTQLIKDGSVEGDTFFVGGAYSIDKQLRTEDFDWWPDEEISHEKMVEVNEAYLKEMPRVMVTHDCPAEVVSYMPYAYKATSRTSQFFNTLWEQHTPEIWVYGHHHNSFDKEIKGTRFVCLAELEMKEIT